MAGEIFISYRRADEAWARLLHKQLQDEGVEAWYDAQIGAGQDWRTATAKALQASRIFVLLFSAAAAESEDIAKELAAAIFSKKLVVPVRIENIQPTGAFLYELASRNWVNAFENTEAKLAELARSLAKLVKAGIADESIIPFDRNAGVKAPAQKRSWLARNPVLIGAAAVAVIVVAAAALLWPHSQPAPSPAQPVATRVAVLPFDTLDGKAEASGFGQAVAEQIITTLNDVQVPTVSRENTATIAGADRDTAALTNGAEFILSGSVQSGDKGLRVTVHLDHASTHATVWTKSYDQAGTEPLEFQTQIATSASDVAQSALKARKKDPFELNDSALGITLKLAEGNRVTTEQNLLQGRSLARQLIAQAPKFSYGYSELAVISAFLIPSAPPDEMARLRADTKSLAARALALDPKNSEPYLALAFLIPNGRWAEREAAFRKGLSVVPDANSLQNFLAGVLSNVGRLREALALQRSSQMLDPLGAPKTFNLAQGLVETGHVTEGLALMDRAAKIWPSHPGGWFVHFDVMANFGRIADAQAMLGTPQYIPVTLEPEAIAAMRAYLNARLVKTPAARLAAENSIRSAMAGGAIPALRGMVMFAALGDVDNAFMLARTLFPRQDTKLPSSPTSALFLTATDSMRRDPRFMALALQAGLVDYWVKTGKWPDFCADPDLPYDCKKEASKIGVAH
jgi:TolB-like protein